MKTLILRNKPVAGRLLMVVIIALYILPLYVAMTNAFKPYEQIVKDPLGLPVPPTLANLGRAISEAKILNLYANSMIITVGSLTLLVLISSMLAFVFARRTSRVTNILYLAVLAGMMIPIQSILIPSIQTLRVLKLLGTLPGLIFFYGGTYVPIGTFLYTEFMRTVPVSLEESAAIDGATPITTFFQIIFPLLKSCTATVIIFLGMWIWNDFLPPMYILGSARGRTITTGIYSAIGTYTTDWSLVFAAVLLASLPIVILYLFLQRQFQSGLTAGSFK